MFLEIGFLLFEIKINKFLRGTIGIEKTSGYAQRRLLGEWLPLRKKKMWMNCGNYIYKQKIMSTEKN